MTWRKGFVLPFVAGVVLTLSGTGQGQAETASAHHGGATPENAPPLAPHTVVHDVGVTAFEPTIGLTSDGAVFFQAVGPMLAPQVFRSDDDGDSWADVSPHVAGVQSHPITNDPYLYVDEPTNRVFTVDDGGCKAVAFSDDGGTTWTNSAACGHMDFQKIFAGPPALSPTVSYPNVVYMCAIEAGFGIQPGALSTRCSKSLDGGVSWLPTGLPPFSDDPTKDDGAYVHGHCGGGAPPGVVGSDGTVYLARGWCGTPTIAISEDEGATWERIQISDREVYRAADWDIAIPGLLSLSHSYPSEITQSALAIDDADGLHFVWIASDRLPYLSSSTDGGRTWTEAVMIAPPGVTEASNPDVVAAGPGKVAVAYMGTTNSPGAPFPNGDDYECPTSFQNVCLGGGPHGTYYPDFVEAYEHVTWTGYLTVTDEALSADPLFYSGSAGSESDPLIQGACGTIRCHGAGDFFDVQISPDGTPWAAFVDMCPGGECLPPEDWGVGIAARMIGGPTLR